MSQASLATAHAGPFALTLCLGVVGMALLSLGGITGVGVALHGLLRRVRDWLTRHTSGTRRPTASVACITSPDCARSGGTSGASDQRISDSVPPNTSA